MDPTRPAPPLRSPSLPAVGSAAVAAGLYAVTLGGTFAYDDLSVVRDDPRQHDPALWGHLWTQGYTASLDNLYRPLVSSSYAAQWWASGDRPWAFHAVNVGLHAGCAAAVAEVARRATGRAAVAWTAGLLFAALPVHAEAVANVVGRAELACTLAVLASLAILLRRPLSPARAAAVVACGAAAVLSKEQGVLAPLLWAGCIALLWRDRPAGRERAVVRGAALATVWLWAAYLLVREHYLKFDWDRGLLDRAMQPMVHTVGVQRLLLPVALLGRYAALTVWPAHLSPDYGGDVIGPATAAADPYLWIGVGVACGGIAVAVWQRRSRVAVFALLAAAVCYAPVANLFTIIGAIFGERLVYLPSAFVAVLAGVAAGRLRGRVRVAAVAAVLVPMGVATVAAAAAWNRPHDLYARALAAHPGSVQLHLLVADCDADEGRPAERAAVLDDACRRFPDNGQCWANRARAAADAGDFDAADDFVRRGVRGAFSPYLQSAQAYVDQARAAARRPPSTSRRSGGR